jgi:molybdopterin-containing oxidoreductase family membrane subunit
MSGSNNAVQEPSRQSRAFQQITDEILAPLWKPGRWYWLLLFLAGALAVIGGVCWFHQINAGLGVAGITRPAGWGIYIASFVFWVGIAHSGTLISAVLYLFQARWRVAISRTAEAMTVFAIMTAGLFPLIHLGRPWFFYWLIPYPNQRHLWVNFRSPLIWDVFAVGTYFILSVVFWYLGMIPDLAAVRDRTAGSKRAVYGILSLGWRGSGRQWRHFRASYLFLASLATPLVVSVHSVVSWDFAMGIAPGWHSTIFAPYFVAGAIFSGLAMVCTLVIPLRKAFHLERYITLDHFNQVSKLLLFMSLIVSYSYIVEFFVAWYSGNPFERSSFYYRAFGSYAGLFWLMTVCNCIVPLLLSFAKTRTNLKALLVISLLINLGMYLERFVIIPVSLTHDFNPYIWRVYSPTVYEYGILAGSFGFFFFWFLLFIKFVPVLPIFEIKELAKSSLQPSEEIAA